MHSKYGDRMRRRFWMFSKDKLRSRFARHRKVILRERHVTRIIRPSMPATTAHFPHKIARAEHRPAAAIIISVISRVEFSIRRKSQAEWIAKTPRDELRCASPGRYAHNSAGRGNSSADNLTGRGRTPVRQKSAGENVSSALVRLKVFPSQHDITRGNVVEFREPF